MADQSYSQFHPPALRPGGPSPSGSPQPNLQQQLQYQQSGSQPNLFIDESDMPSYTNQMRHPSGSGPSQNSGPLPSQSHSGPLRSQSPPLPSMALNNQYGGRFPSAQYGPPQSPTNDAGNPFTEGPGQQQQQQQHQPHSRSRSSTFGQSYPIPVSGGPPGHGGQGPPPMPFSPPQQMSQPAAQPLVPQHSGYQQAGPHGPPSQPMPSGSSRPVSRGGPQGASAPNTRPTSSKSPFSTPITAPPRQRPSQILLINPNSSRGMTDNMMNALRPIIPPGVELTAYTAPYPAPTAIESTTDAIMSTEAVLRDLAKHAATNGETVQNFDGMIVACFSKHPLIDALRESYDVPVIGIMEGSMYVARMLGGRFGFVATNARSKILQDDQVTAYGLSHYYVGSEATHLGVLELDARPKEEVAKRVMHAARALAVKGADTIILGCAGMVDMTRAAKDAVRDEDGRRTINVIDPVEAGLVMMSSLVGMGIPTSKKGMYKGEKEARRSRGQNWL